MLKREIRFFRPNCSARALSAELGGIYIRFEPTPCFSNFADPSATEPLSQKSASKRASFACGTAMVRGAPRLFLRRPPQAREVQVSLVRVAPMHSTWHYDVCQRSQLRDDFPRLIELSHLNITGCEKPVGRNPARLFLQ